MTLSMILGFFWVIAAAITATLPMKYQFFPGSVLLLVTLPLIAFIGYENGWVMTFIALFAVLSMFRRPLIYYTLRAMGKPVERPKEIQDILDKRT